MAFDVGAFDYTKYGNIPGANVFGNADISAARRQFGASNYQVRQLMQRANLEGVPVASISKDWVERNAPKPEWNYGSRPGYWGFGMEDVNAIGDLETVKRHRDWAQQNRLNIGPGVSDWINEQQIAAIPDTVIADIPIPSAPEWSTPKPAELPGSQTGQANVGAAYNALGIRTPRPAGYDLNTGGTKKAFGRDKKNKDIALAQLAINPLTL